MQGQEAFNPFQFSGPLYPGHHESPIHPNIHDSFTRTPYRGSQDSNASTLMHTDGVRHSVDDRPSMESIRSGFGSPPSPSTLNANSGTRGDSLFAFASGGAHQQQHQPQSSLGGVQAHGGTQQSVFQTSGPPPLGSGRGLETMLEDEDHRVR